MKKGQSIVETVIATALISIAVVAALALVNYTQKQASYSRLLNLAVDYNSEATDWLRQEKSVLGWSTLAGKVASQATGSLVIYCLNSLPTDSQGGFTALTPGFCDTNSSINGTVFSRYVTIDDTNQANGSLTATVVVLWQDTAPRQNASTLELTQWN